MRLPCFSLVRSIPRLVLPAFGCLTGGFPADRSSEQWVVADETVLPLPNGRRSVRQGAARVKQGEQGSIAAPTAPRTWRWLLWSALGVPLAGLTFLIAIAPSSPKREQVTAATDSELLAPMVSDSFRYLPDKDVYALDFDPRKVQFDLFEGWDREQDAYGDRGSLAFVSGPMYERHYSDDGREETVPSATSSWAIGSGGPATAQPPAARLHWHQPPGQGGFRLRRTHARTGPPLRNLHRWSARALQRPRHRSQRLQGRLQRQHGPAHPLLPAPHSHGDGPAG